MIRRLLHRLRHAAGMRLLALVVWLLNPAPVPSDKPQIADLVIADLRRMGENRVTRSLVSEVERRRLLGLAKYGHALQAGNGRDPWTDALGEFLDGAKYLRQAAEEARHPAARRMAHRLQQGALAIAVQIERIRARGVS